MRFSDLLLLLVHRKINRLGEFKSTSELAPAAHSDELHVVKPEFVSFPLDDVLLIPGLGCLAEVDHVANN